MQRCRLPVREIWKTKFYFLGSWIFPHLHLINKFYLPFIIISFSDEMS